MARAEFTLQTRDKSRLLKDRLVRMAVTCGGVGVLAALVLIFVYLAMVVLPLFSDAKLEPNKLSMPIAVEKPLALAVDDYGLRALTITQQGRLTFWQLDNAKPILDVSITEQPVAFAQSIAALDTYGFVTQQGQVTLFKPRFNSSLAQNVQPPEVEFYRPTYDFQIAAQGADVERFAFSSTQSSPTLVWLMRDGTLKTRWTQNVNGESTQIDFQFPSQIPHVDQLLITPDGETIYLRTASELMVAKKRDRTFYVREVVDLTLGDKKHSVRNMVLLAGAYSLLVTHDDGRVSQWFDTRQEKKRQLTHIRDFKLASEVQFLLPDTHRKGFYSFYTNGTLQSHYTTSEKLALFLRAYSQAPQLAAMSNNEQFLLTYFPGRLSLATVDNPYPEISLSSLWQKVWYEGYPEPEFVWQSTSANDDFEAKFSLVPIAFGTIKAALFAMLFSVPIAVLGAIYTGYFMAPKMRRIVKPSIELMEAMPTVIIGFLAGLWFAPIVEQHLINVVTLMVVLPLSTVVVGAGWMLLPSAWRHKVPNGWHAVILMPSMVLVVMMGVEFAPGLESLLFEGDIRLFLSQHGIGFDQRNAMVVGLAMGFAVIPTIFTIAEDAIFSVPKHLSDGSLALGATAWQTLMHVVLLTASPGIFSAVMMGLGRAVGETMIVLMATGNTPLMDWNILEGMRTLSATIAVELPESEVGSSHFRLLFLAALLLFVFTFAVNSVAEWVRQRLRDKYRAL
ncbi:TPA: ABC transporter permease subunit [Vibrio vulnificus]|uniref:ABC transporter permease subunit n=1 Tax=Vibrio sp. 05-20-BW147 TaxID=2575834 RepID=UPI001592E339|nr:ABC transporter permease subunit [Vibrio sp. 05-20-BW147]NVC62933.1 ABC transporter permease subunit [Vibrio sp. 05-20-BW147]HAS6348881.1 ABC transporter permease subunit [Vibrio vulnificus]